MQIPHGECPAVYTLHYFDTVHFNSAGDYEKPAACGRIPLCTNDPLWLPARQFGKIVRQNEPRSTTTDVVDAFHWQKRNEISRRKMCYGELICLFNLFISQPLLLLRHFLICPSHFLIVTFHSILNECFNFGERGSRLWTNVEMESS